MTNFQRGTDYPSRRGFTYTDEDGDTVRVWFAGAGYRDAGLRISSSSVYVPASDVPRFLAEIAWVQKKPCEACGGEGFK